MTKNEALELLEVVNSILERVRSAFPECDAEADMVQRRLEDVMDVLEAMDAEA